MREVVRRRSARLLHFTGIARRPAERLRHPAERPRRPGAIGLALLLGACGGESSSPRAAVEFGPPPETAVETVADTLHGQVIEDPYRWLEDQEAPATREWIDRENAYTDSILRQLPGRDALREIATKLLKTDVMGTPTEKGGRYFYRERKADQDLFVLHYRDEPAGQDHILLDPHGMSEDHTTSVGFRDISRDGQLVAYSVRLGGVDEVEIRFRDVDAGRDLPDVLPTARYGGVSLTPDKRGLYYSRFGNRNPRIYYHSLGTDPSSDREIFGRGYGPAEIPFASLSDDGRWLLIHVIHGSSGPTEIYLRDLSPGGETKTVIKDGVSHTFAGFAGDRLLLTTDLDAPNKRVVTAELANPSVASWREVVPESEDAVIQSATGAGGSYFVSYLKDVQPRVAQYDADGNKLREIEFDVIGSVSGVSGEWDRPEAFFTFSSFHVPPTIYRLNVATGEKEIWARRDVPIDRDRIEVKQVWYASKDGTKIPMFLVYRKGLELDGDNPTLLTGYGGFDVSLTPGFSATAAAWVQSGGVFARPNLRGGGEFGEAWHMAGMFGHKQNVFDDFIAAAEWLIREGYTSPEHLAIRGGSNGGLLVGAAMTQRPDLFGAVVCAYPLLDMLRYQKFLVARFWVPEYGSAEDPEQFRYLRAYSPYQNVHPGTAYPATLFITGDGDTRVAPLHARKMAALVQADNGGGNPILLRYHTKAGHSGGQPLGEQIDEMVDTFSFLRWRVGGR
ncbi:MAG: prolyl oligopeptidase family protein [Gemmatimonadota bacterium]